MGLIAALGSWWAVERREALESARLEAVAELRAQQVADWIDERRQQYALLGRSPYWSVLRRLAGP